jgi:hypothetical protein
MLEPAPGTLRNWSSDSDSPIKPRKINGRLRWRLDDIRALKRRRDSFRRPHVETRGILSVLFQGGRSCG